MFDELVLTSLKGRAPGPELAALLADPNLVVDPVDRLTGWQRQLCWTEAGLNDALLAVAGPASGDPEDEDWGREEAATALAWSNGYAGDRIELARTLATRLFASRALLRKGQLTLRHIVEVAKHLQRLDDDLARRAEAAILDKAPGRTPAQLGGVA